METLARRLELCQQIEEKKKKLLFRNISAKSQ